jgi:hypothetical protein
LAAGVFQRQKRHLRVEHTDVKICSESRHDPDPAGVSETGQQSRKSVALRWLDTVGENLFQLIDQQQQSGHWRPFKFSVNLHSVRERIEHRADWLVPICRRRLKKFVELGRRLESPLT